MLSQYIVLLQKECQTWTPKYTRAKEIILRYQGCKTIVLSVTWRSRFDPFNIRLVVSPLSNIKQQDRHKESQTEWLDRAEKLPKAKFKNISTRGSFVSPLEVDGSFDCKASGWQRSAQIWPQPSTKKRWASVRKQEAENTRNTEYLNHTGDFQLTLFQTCHVLYITMLSSTDTITTRLSMLIVQTTRSHTDPLLLSGNE